MRTSTTETIPSGGMKRLESTRPYRCKSVRRQTHGDARRNWAHGLWDGSVPPSTPPLEPSGNGWPREMIIRIYRKIGVDRTRRMKGWHKEEASASFFICKNSPIRVYWGGIGTEGFEPSTACRRAKCSVQLSYAPEISVRHKYMTHIMAS